MRAPSAKRGKEPSRQREPSLTPGRFGWFLALSVAALLHLAAVALVFWSSHTEPEGQAKAAGTGGVEIALGPAGRAVGGAKAQQGEDTPEPVNTPEPESVELEPELEPEPEPEPEPEKTPPPRPEKLIEPVKKTEPVKKPVTEPVPESKPDTTPVKEPPPPPQASTAGAAGNSGSTEQNNTGSGDNTAGGGLPGDTRDYAATLLAWLERHKEYPRRARLRRQQGTVLLYFMVDREGRVLDYRIQQSAGHVTLDEEVRKMIERAQPLPAMPDTMDDNTLELVVPVQFFLR
ncbi:MAG: energy transducer TonB [Alcanivorax sp.]|uniref:energy transducer TonB n=1 Tax=Alcanivorax sp. TaxID=1872427 RepID=UPI003DA70D71